MQFRKTILLWLIVCMFLTSSAFADTDGDYTYTVSGGNATITAYTGTGTVISIPATLGGSAYPTVAIAASAFDGKTTLTSVTFQSPSSVTSIGSFAFVSCSGLTSVTIPGSVTSIGNGAFVDCASLMSINVDASNSSYISQDGVLYNLNKTTLVVYPSGKSGAFSIPSGVTSIGYYAFGYCTGLTSVTIPGSVTSIGGQAFRACYGLTSIDIPASVTSIGSYAFNYCHGLTSVTIPNSITSIAGSTFLGCNALTSINIPASITSIGNAAFKDCTVLASAYFYGNAPTMGTDVFTNCASGLTVYYLAGATGFTNPWYTYPTAVFTPPSTTTTTTPTTTSTITPATTTTTTTNATTTTTTTTTKRCPSRKALGDDEQSIEQLQDFRDNTLAQSAIGRKVIQIYYTNADSINTALERSPALRGFTKRVLEVIAPMVGRKEE